MKDAAPRMPRALGLSGALVGSGLAIEAISIHWAHPTSFLLFAFVGVGLVGAGVLYYLWTIARA